MTETRNAPPATADDTAHRAARHRAIAAAPQETIVALRAAAAAGAALARLDAMLERSPVRGPAVAAFELLDAAACVALDHVPLDSATLLCAPPAARDPAVQRMLELRRLVRREGVHGIDAALLLSLGARENGNRPGVRARALGTRERATLMPEEKPPRGEALLQAGLRDWVSLIDRGGRDVQPLVLIAAAHRRWLALRPFASGNVRLAQLLDGELMRGEGLTRTLDLPLARWFARRIEVYRARLHAGAADEPGWIAWWLEGVAHACEETQEQLLAWEGLREQLLHHPAVQRVGPADQALSVLLRPQCEHQEAVAASGLSRAIATRWLESLVDEGVLRGLSGARERRYAHVGVLRLLLEPAAA